MTLTAYYRGYPSEYCCGGFIVIHCLLKLLTNKIWVIIQKDGLFSNVNDFHISMSSSWVMLYRFTRCYLLFKKLLSFINPALTPPVGMSKPMWRVAKQGTEDSAPLRRTLLPKSTTNGIKWIIKIHLTQLSYCSALSSRLTLCELISEI